MTTAVSPEDRGEILDLLSRYNFAIDLGDTHGWADCFTPDGSFECLGLPDGSPMGGSHAGRDALVAYAQGHYDVNQGRARHWNWNTLITACSPDSEGRPTATMQAYLNAYSAGLADDAQLRATGIYRDQLAKTDDGWRFTARQVTVDSR